jgi:DNA-binding response OmpR family regulator
VLVVNTDPQLRRTIAAVLTAEGFKTTTAEDEPSALLAMATSEFSIVVIEKNLQTLDDGPKIVRQGRLRHPRLKALYLSAYFDSLSGDPDLDSWVPMPFRIGELVSCTWELHCRGRQPSTVIMPLFDVEIGRSVSIQRTAAAPIPTVLPLVITVRHRRPSATRRPLQRRAGRALRFAM